MLCTSCSATPDDHLQLISLSYDIAERRTVRRAAELRQARLMIAIGSRTRGQRQLVTAPLNLRRPYTFLKALLEEHTLLLRKVGERLADLVYICRKTCHELSH